MEQPALAAFVLANQGVGDVQGDAVAEGRQAVDFGDGRGQGLRAGLEADDVIDAADREAVKVARYPDVVVVEERGNVDDLRQLAADEGGDKGLPPNAVPLLAEFEVAPDEVAEDGAVGAVEGLLVPTGLRGAGVANAVLFGEFIKAGEAQVGDLDRKSVV